MGTNGHPAKQQSVTIHLGDVEGRIEKLVQKGSGPARIRISCWSESNLYSLPLDVSEKELISLLQKAIRAGILSPEFLNDLHSEFEI